MMLESIATMSSRMDGALAINSIATGLMTTSPLGHGGYVDEVNNGLDKLNDKYAHALLPFAIIMGIFCVVGVLGNGLVITIFSVSHEYRNTNFRVFVISLGIIDMLSCITLLPAEIFKTKHYFSFNPMPCKVKCFFNIFAMNAAAYVLLVICVDRYRKVCQPLKRQIYPELAGKILAFVIFAALVLSIPAPIMCGIQKENVTTAENATIVVQVCSAEEKYHHSILRYVYKLGLSITLFIVAFSFIIMYIMIVKAIIRHRRQRSHGDSIRFESSKPKPLTTDKGTDNIYVRVHLVICPNGCTETNHLIKVPSVENCKLKLTGVDMKMKRHQSTSSVTSSSSKSRFRLWRSGSDVSFRSKSLQDRSLARTTTRFPYKTLIWLTLTLIFIVTFFLNACLSFLTLNGHKFSPMNMMWFQVFFRLYYVNHVINPVVYAVLDKRFKSSCKRLFIRVKKMVLHC
mgnify:CR=1 FL=1